MDVPVERTSTIRNKVYTVYVGLWVIAVCPGVWGCRTFIDTAFLHRQNVEVFVNSRPFCDLEGVIPSSVMVSLMMDYWYHIITDIISFSLPIAYYQCHIIINRLLPNPWAQTYMVQVVVPVCCSLETISHCSTPLNMLPVWGPKRRELHPSWAVC